MISNKVRVAVTQHESVWLDLEGSIKKTCAIIAEAGGSDAQLVVFPEVFIPGYPAWIYHRLVDHDLGTRYVKNSLRVDSEEMRQLCRQAAESNITVALGFSERVGDSVYVAQVIVGDDGVIKSHRRKLKPTHMERTIFGDASGEALGKIAHLPYAKVGSLNCWEHIQPLLKYYTIAQGEQIHLSAWPPIDPFIPGEEKHFASTVEGCDAISRTYAIESQAWVLHCAGVITQPGIDLMKIAGSDMMGIPIGGCSKIFCPDGRLLDTGHTPDEQLIIADLDMDLIIKAKTSADPIGHYSRPDLLWLGADPTKRAHVKKQELEGSYL